MGHEAKPNEGGSPSCLFLCSPLRWNPPPALSNQVPPKLLSVEAQHPAAMPDLH